MASVWVITADTDYEGNAAMLAFDSAEGAAQFISSIRAYAETWKIWDDDPNDAARDAALFAKWERWQSKWNKKHPAGADWAHYRGDFSVIEVPFRLAAKEAKP